MRSVELRLVGQQEEEDGDGLGEASSLRRRSRAGAPQCGSENPCYLGCCLNGNLDDFGPVASLFQAWFLTCLLGRCQSQRQLEGLREDCFNRA